MFSPWNLWQSFWCWAHCLFDYGIRVVHIHSTVHFFNDTLYRWVTDFISIPIYKQDVSIPAGMHDWLGDNNSLQNLNYLQHVLHVPLSAAGFSCGFQVITDSIARVSGINGCMRIFHNLIYLQHVVSSGLCAATLSYACGFTKDCLILWPRHQLDSVLLVVLWLRYYSDSVM